MDGGGIGKAEREDIHHGELLWRRLGLWAVSEWAWTRGLERSLSAMMLNVRNVRNRCSDAGNVDSHDQRSFEDVDLAHAV